MVDLPQSSDSVESIVCDAIDDVMPTIKAFRRRPAENQTPEDWQEIVIPVLKNSRPVQLALDAVDAEEAFGYLREGWIQVEGSGASLGPRSLFFMFLDVAEKGEDVLTLIKELKHFASDGMSAPVTYLPIAGVQVSAVIDLTDSWSLMPWSDIPDGDDKRDFSARKFDGSSSILELYNRIFASAALRYTGARRRILFSNSEEGEKAFPHEVVHKIDLQRHPELQEILGCLVAASCRVVVTLGQWQVESASHVRRMAPSFRRYHDRLLDRQIKVCTEQPHNLDTSVVQQLVQGVTSLTSKDRAALHIGLARLNEALIYRTLVDSAIDLGVALEAILLHGTGSSRGELNFRSALRGAAFLGGDRTRRMQIYRNLKHAYELRSSAVHTGSLDSRQTEAQSATLGEAAQHCAEIAKRIILHREFPDWDELVIGG